MTITATTRIPAPRVPFINERSGQISREWYLFLFQVQETISLSTDFLSGVKNIVGDYAPDNDAVHLMCSGDITISLPSYTKRDKVLTVTNIGTGVITIEPETGELIQDDTSKELDFQWTTVQLCPKTGGYVII